MNKKLIAAMAGTLAFSVTLAKAETLSALFMSQAAYSEADIKAMTDSFTKKNPGVDVKLEFVPYEGLRDKIIAAKGAGASGYDVVLFDVIWPAEFAANKIVRDVTDKMDKSEIDKIVDGAWTTVRHDNKYWGMPWIIDTKYLFYNKDILAKAGIKEPPKTWAEVAEQSKLIKSKGLVKYPVVWSWSQSEAMICDYTTLVLAFKGDKGGFFGKPGAPAFDGGAQLAAAKFMKSTLDDGITNPNSREYAEEDVRKVFSNGEAAFALNWTYMYNMANDPKESKVVGKVGIVPAPGVAGASKASAVNGSMGLGITTGSKNPDLAWKYIKHMTSKDVQESFAKLSLPIWKASYDSAAVRTGQETLVDAAKVSLGVMAGRPEGVAYTELSNIMQKRLHGALLNKGSVEDAMKSATKDARKLKF